VDPKVLEAQQWVNGAYGHISGYVRCPENGKTGWATMRALTSGLQAELGITPVNGSFGPATLAKLTQRGDIRPGDTNQFIIRILKHALFCKGYNGGAADGGFDGGMVTGLTKLLMHSGLTGHGASVQPKVAKALLTMDAYVLLSGGTEKVREIQQWLNSTYYARSTFFIIPCDGLFSRDVQQALMKALQYGFGIPDESANGLFGEATRAGLRGNVVAQGSNGRFVELFSAACVFNGPARYRTQDGKWAYREASFTAAFDESLAGYVRAFQQFSVLPVTGKGDYATWAQLLVSFGDTDRPTTACDTSHPLTAARARALYASGYRIVGRYLDNAPGGRNKKIQPGELKHIFDAGLRVFPIWQYGARELGDFSYAEGREHAVLAHRSAEGHGFGRGTVLYFAVDYDATDEEITSNIVPYFHGVQSGLAAQGRRYVAGVYGSRNVCSRVSGETFARWSFVSGMSWRFSGNLGYPLPENWSFNQIKEFQFQVGGESFGLDGNVHQPHADPGTASVGSSVDPIATYLAYIDDLYRLAREYGRGVPNRLVLEYLRHPTYTHPDGAWPILIGDVDRDWITYAERRAPARVLHYEDPSHGVTISVDHFGATANGVLLKAEGAQAARGDFSGWGGDLSSFYGEWRAASDSYASGYAFCQDRLARVDVPSSFPFNDLIEDADGYLIGMEAYRGAPVNEAIRRHLAQKGHLTRFTQFLDRRYGGSAAGAVSAARTMLVNGDDKDLAVIRAAVVVQAGGMNVLQPHHLPDEKLTPFLRGYAEKLVTLAQQESG
jgi:peptidoglycan hydrolase-like protein with peptidoglycan-binding domain